MQYIVLCFSKLEHSTQQRGIIVHNVCVLCLIDLNEKFVLLYERMHILLSLRKFVPRRDSMIFMDDPRKATICEREDLACKFYE